MPINHSERGYTLLSALIMILIVGLIILASSYALLSEQKQTNNQSDRSYTLQLAERALRDGETRAAELHALLNDDQSIHFDISCANEDNPPGYTRGLCLSSQGSEEPAWARMTGNLPYLDDDNRTFSVINSQQGQARYIIEALGRRNTSNCLYRITAKSTGKNSNTSVTLQSQYLISGTDCGV